MNVTCKFEGRYGNNLFMVAAMMGLCARTGQSWGIPKHYHHKPIYIHRFPLFTGNPRKLHQYEAIDIKDHGFHEIPHFPNGVHLHGFFQSYKYFDHIKDEVVNRFNFANYPQYKDFTSVHIRLGDYVEHAGSFPPVTLDYIKQAFEIIKPKKVLVFSDEVNKCRGMFGEFSDIHFEFSPGKKEQPNGGRTEFEQISAMSSCQNNIIANSTFSFWGAYCNRNPDKIVVSPHYKSWFGPKAQNLDTSDLLPPEWRQIQFR